MSIPDHSIALITEFLVRRQEEVSLHFPGLFADDSDTDEDIPTYHNIHSEEDSEEDEESDEDDDFPDP